MNLLTDPMISHGPFRVLTRADGAFIVLDNRRPAGLQTVEVFSPVMFIGPGVADPKAAAKAAADADAQERAKAAAA